MKNRLRAKRFMERKIQFIKLTLNENFKYKSISNLYYPDIISCLEEKLIRDEFIKYKGSLYVIDKECEALCRLNNSKQYKQKKKERLLNNKDNSPVFENLSIFFINENDLPEENYALLLANKNAFAEDLKEFKKWKNYEFSKENFEERKFCNIEIRYVDTENNSDFIFPLYVQYKKRLPKYLVE